MGATLGKRIKRPMVPVLPKKVEIYNYDNSYTREELEERIPDILSNEYGYCINSFNFEVKNDTIYISNIDWDTSE